MEELLIYLTEKQHLGSVGGGVFVKGKIELVFFLYMYITNTLNENLACQHLNLAYAKSGGLLPVQALASDARRISRSNILELTRLFEVLILTPPAALSVAALCAIWTTTKMFASASFRAKVPHACF